MKSSRLLGIVVVLQGVILLGQWTGGPRISAASAQIPDPGAQRGQMVDELREVNKKLDRIVNVLESGKLQVATGSSDDKKDAPQGR